ncbi:MAG: VWA domain-containing protein [Acidobacteriota bacterium]
MRVPNLRLLGPLSLLLFALPTAAADYCLGLSAPLDVPPGSSAGQVDGLSSPSRPQVDVRQLDAGERIRLPLVDLYWHVEVFGALATGRLEATFENPHGELELQPSLRLTGMRDVEAVVLHEGERLPLDLQAPAKKGKRAGARPAAGRRAQRLARAASRSLDATLPVFVPPGEQVTVELSTTLRLGFSDGHFELELPDLSERCSGEPTLDVVVDVLTDNLDGVEGSHDVLTWAERGRTELTLPEPLSARESFSLRLGIGRHDEADGSTHLGVEQGDGTRDVLLTVTPPVDGRRQPARSKDVLFVLDRSGSMKRHGKLGQAREALARALDSLGPDDRFNLVAFNNKAEAFRAVPVRAASSERVKAEDWLRLRGAQGGTRMLPAVKAALTKPADGERHRLMVILTDGAIADETGVGKFLTESAQDVRLLLIGIGNEPSGDVLVRLAERARGDALIAASSEDIRSTLGSLLESFARPLAWDLKLDWGGAEVVSQSPARIPDLYADRPITVRAKVRGPLPSDVRVVGDSTRGRQGLELTLPVAGRDEHEGLRLPSRRQRR